MSIPLTIVRYVFRPTQLAVDQIQHTWVFEGSKEEQSLATMLAAIGKDIDLLRETREITSRMQAEDEPESNRLIVAQDLLNGNIAYQDICAIYNNWSGIKIIPQVISYGFTTITVNGSFTESQHAF